MDTVKPFLKWVGGKTQIIGPVMSQFPQEINNYYEPFLGGGSVLLALLTYKANGNIHISGKIYANDINSNLIGVYKNIQSSPDELICEVKKIITEYTKATGSIVNRKPITLQDALTSPESYYFWIRSRFNAFSKEDRMSIPASAMFIFMNKTGFRGLYREGPRGFNVPYGNYKHPTIIDEAHIKAVSTLIRDVVFTHASFQDALSTMGSGDFVYLDPPYAPESETSFVGYNAGGFSIENHTALFMLCGEMEKKGIMMLMSNANVKIVRDAFPDDIYETTIISCKRSIHSKNPGARTNEVLLRTT